MDDMNTTPNNTKLDVASSPLWLTYTLGGLVGALYQHVQLAAKEDERNAKLDVVVNEFFQGSGIVIQPAMRPFLRMLAEIDLRYDGSGKILLVECVEFIKSMNSK